MPSIMMWARSVASRVEKRAAWARKVVRYGSQPVEYLRRRTALSRIPGAVSNDCVEELRTNGFSVITAGIESYLVQDFLHQVEVKLAGADRSQRGRKKTFWTDMISAEDRTSGSILVRHVLQPKVLSIVGAYLGQVPYLADLELTLSQPTPPDQWKVSQLWHRDYNDSKTVKFFTYGSDVLTSDDGPFTFIPAPVSKAIPHRRFPTHKRDAELRALGWQGEHMQVMGEKATGFIIDTHRCYHMGSRVAPGHFRVALIATFVTFANYGRYDNRIRLQSDVSPLEKMVLSL